MTTTTEIHETLRHPTSLPGVEARLIPPYADEWGRRLGHAADRAREWAMGREYLLVRPPYLCAHAAYSIPECPVYGCMDRSVFDHATMWYGPRQGDRDTLFILTAPYTSSAAPERMDAYARAHGVRLDAGFEDFWPQGDDWYSPGYVRPYRLDLTPTHVMLPLERELATLASAYPFVWPEREEL